MNKTFLLAATLASIAAGSAAFAATPVLQMQLTSGAATSGILNTGAGGTIIYSSPLGNFTTNAEIGSGAAAGLGNSIDLSSLNVTATAAGTLTIELTETNLTGSALTATQFLSNISGQIGINSTTLTSLSYTTYISAANTAFTLGTVVGATQTFSSPSGGAAGTAFATTPAGGKAGSATTGALFSETLVVTLTTNGSSKTSLDATVGPNNVPEPAAMLPLMFGIGALGMAVRRRQRSTDA